MPIPRNTMVPGGRIELPTPAFSGLRSTNELPRHSEEQTFYTLRREKRNSSGGVKREDMA